MYLIDSHIYRKQSYTRILLTRKNYDGKLRKVDMNMQGSPVIRTGCQFQTSTKYLWHAEFRPHKSNFGIEVDHAGASWLFQNCEMFANAHSKVNKAASKKTKSKDWRHRTFRSPGCYYYNRILNKTCPFNFTRIDSHNILKANGLYQRHQLLKCRYSMQITPACRHCKDFDTKKIGCDDSLHSILSCSYGSNDMDKNNIETNDFMTNASNSMNFGDLNIINIEMRCSPPTDSSSRKSGVDRKIIETNEATSTYNSNNELIKKDTQIVDYWKTSLACNQSNDFDTKIIENIIVILNSIIYTKSYEFNMANVKINEYFSTNRSCKEYNGFSIKCVKYNYSPSTNLKYNQCDSYNTSTLAIRNSQSAILFCRGCCNKLDKVFKDSTSQTSVIGNTLVAVEKTEMHNILSSSQFFLHLLIFMFIFWVLKCMFEIVNNIIKF